MMIPNAIVEEIRRIRHRLAAQFDNDVEQIGAEIRRAQAASGHRVVRRPKRQPAGATASAALFQQSEISGRDSSS